MCTADNIYNYICISLPVSHITAANLQRSLSFQIKFPVHFYLLPDSFLSSPSHVRHRQADDWVQVLISISLSVSDIQVCPSSDNLILLDMNFYIIIK